MCVSVLCEATLPPKSPRDLPLGCVPSGHCKFGGTRWKEMAGLLEISTACNSVFCFPNTTTYTYKERVFTGGLTWKENSHRLTSAFSISQCSFWWLKLVCAVFWAAVKYLEKFCCSQGQLNTLAFLFFFPFNTGRNNHLVKFSKWLPVTAGKDIIWFWQVRRERRNWSWDFFFSFSCLYFSSWHRKVCLFDKLM